MSFQVIFSPEAEDDLQRLFDPVLERALHSTTDDLEIAARAIDAIGGSAFVRELVIPFGATGYVAMFEIQDAQVVLIGAVRHQRESDHR